MRSWTATKPPTATTTSPGSRHCSPRRSRGVASPPAAAPSRAAAPPCSPTTRASSAREQGPIRSSDSHPLRSRSPAPPRRSTPHTRSQADRREAWHSPSATLPPAGRSARCTQPVADTRRRGLPRFSEPAGARRRCSLRSCSRPVLRTPRTRPHLATTRLDRRSLTPPRQRQQQPRPTRTPGPRRAPASRRQRTRLSGGLTSDAWQTWSPRWVATAAQRSESPSGCRRCKRTPPTHTTSPLVEPDGVTVCRSRCADPHLLGYGQLDCAYTPAGALSGTDLACDAAPGFNGARGVETPNPRQRTLHSRLAAARHRALCGRRPRAGSETSDGQSPRRLQASSRRSDPGCTVRS